MSGEAGGTIVGLGLLILGGPFLISTLMVAGIVGATAVGVGSLAMQGGKTFSGRRRSLRDNNESSSEDDTRIRQELFELFNKSEQQIDKELSRFLHERNEEFRKLQTSFESNQNLEGFIDYVEKNNSELVAEMQSIRNLIVNEYDIRFEDLKNEYDSATKQAKLYIEQRIKNSEDEKRAIQEKSYEYAKDYYQYVKELMKNLENDYPVREVCTDYYELLEKEVAYLSDRLSDEKNNYEDIIVAIEALPIQILEYIRKCEKEILGRGLYYNACINKIEEISNMLDNNEMANARFKLSDILENADEDQVMELNLGEYMIQYDEGMETYTSSYSYIKKNLEDYRMQLAQGYEMIAENELVETYRKIVDLHSFTVNEMFNAVERFRNACMRDEMNDSVFQEFKDMGYIIEKEEDMDITPCYSSFLFTNPETNDHVTIKIEENIFKGSKLKREIENSISIHHNSERTDLLSIEDHRKEIRERIENSLESNDNLKKNRYRPKKLNCNMETYKQ